jgi:hypothetical protein
LILELLILLALAKSFPWFFLDNILYTFEPRKKYVEELVDTDESDVTSDEDDTDDDEAIDHESIGSFAGATAVVYDNSVENTNEALFDPFNQSLATIYTELQAHDKPMDIVPTDDDGKIACDICGRRFKPRGINTHKASHRKQQ